MCSKNYVSVRAKARKKEKKEREREREENKKTVRTGCGLDILPTHFWSYQNWVSINCSPKRVARKVRNS